MRFITTHGFWRSIASEVIWLLAFSEATHFAALPDFKFGNDSVTAAPSAPRMQDGLRVFFHPSATRGSHSAHFYSLAPITDAANRSPAFASRLLD
jgi:hypothetical protein